MEVDHSFRFLNSHILKLAIQEAEKSEHQQRIGAVIFKGKKIVASAFNAVRSNSIPHKFKNFPQSAHAECQAIKKAYRDLSGYSMLVIRINRKGQILLSKPCTFCTAFIEFVGIKSVYYSNSEGKIVKED